MYDIVEIVDNAACGLVMLKPKIEALTKAKQALEVNASTGHRDGRGGSEHRGATISSLGAFSQDKHLADTTHNLGKQEQLRGSIPQAKGS